MKILLFFSIVEMFFCFVKVTCNLYNKSDYYIIRQDDQLEVVVETYSDYFITKKAQIDGNKLIIMKNSQSMKSTFDTIVTKETFEDIILK